MTNELSVEKAIDVLYTIRAYYASMTAGYPKGKDCIGIGDVMCSEIANSCLMAIKTLESQKWIPVSERLPKENEYIGNVCKYYLIQDEYGDMRVAHLSNVGWIPMHSLKAIGDEIIAWMPLPESYQGDKDGENNTDND